MKHLAVDFGAILSKAGLPPAVLEEGDSMMSVISAFENYYVEAENSDLRMHMFGGSAVAVVIEAFRKYYLLVEEKALNMQQKENISRESSSSLQPLGSPPDLPKPTSSCQDTSKTRQDESVGQLYQSISMSKSKKTKDIGIKPNKKKKVTDDRIPDAQTMVGQLQKLDLSPSQLENVLKANRKARGKLSLKRKGHHALGDSSYCEISTSSKNDFVDSDTDMSNETHLSLQSVEDVNSGSKLHTCASLQGSEGKLNSAVLYEETDKEWEAIELTHSQVKSLEKLEDAISVVQPLVKEESQSDEDIQFISEFVSG